MKRLGLVTLSDLPELKAGKGPTTSTIAIARLDNNLRDSRYGRFTISQDDVDGWTKNLTETFGGKIAIDCDHSSDRGGGTRAVGWITGIHQDGKLVTADVEWTKRGARAIRRGDYRHISPTFVQKYQDEHGVNHGRALIGAALTNRPVLRADMPTVSLSRQSFDGVALARSKKSKKSKKGKRGPARPPSPSRVPSNPTSSRPRPPADVDKAIRKMALAAGAPRTEVKLMTSAGVDPGLRSMWAERVLAAADPKPQGRPASYVYAMSQGGGVTALSADDRAGIGANAEPGMRDRIDPERAALDSSARRLAPKLGISYIDAAVAIEHAKEGIKLAEVDGRNDVAHFDSSAPAPVDPTIGKDAEGHWTQAREELFQKDLRRAGAAGVLDLDRAVWDAHSELGRDLAYELAQQQRHQAVADHEAAGQTQLATAQAAEAKRQRIAQGQKLHERQQTRQARLRQAREETVHGGSQVVGDGHGGDVVPW